MSVTAADVLTGFRGAWTSQGVLAALVRGGLHEGFVDEQAHLPYARVRVAPLDRQQLSGGSIETYRVTVEVWGDQGASNLGVRVAKVLDKLDNRPALWSVRGATAVMGVIPDAPDELEKDARREGKDVSLARRAWRVVLDVR